MKLFAASEYQDRACRLFETIAAQVARQLPGATLAHVGASSIPGAVSKGDVDICVLVAPHDHAHAVQTLAAAGWVIKQGTLRTPELCMLDSPRKDDDVALQVVAQGSRFEFFLHFRDALRADPALVAAYNQLKYRFADGDVARYREEKSAFIDAVLRKAIQ